MNIHEYQAKILLSQYGIPLPAFGVAASREEAAKVIEDLGIEKGVVKVQIHAGGRGKAGGVKLGEGLEQLLEQAESLIGMRVQNRQTGPKGVVSEKVLITPAVSIKKEYYLAAIIDRNSATPIIMASPEGGMEIEEIAAKHPDRLMKIPIQLSGKVRGYHLLALAKFMGWSGDLAKSGMKLVAKVARAFLQSDASLLEINPLVLTCEGELLALDAKLAVDANALYRQAQIAGWYDPSQLTEGEVMAAEYDLAYIGLDGAVGCLVNGAGLAMATMDIIQYYGGSPANFLDVGGGASKEQVAHGFKIILSDPKVKSIFVNIFGGIMDCGVLAEGIVEASKQGVSVPLVVRMEGTNVEVGKKILAESGLNIITAANMADGAQKVVKWAS